MHYHKLATLYEALEKSPKRLEKTWILSKFLPEGDTPVILLLQGRLFPNWDQRELGMASQLVVKVLSVASEKDIEVISSLWKQYGDLGEVALHLAKEQSGELTVDHVFHNLRKLAQMGGAGSVERKIQLVADLLKRATPIEAKYIVRTVLGELRVGLGEGTIRDAITWAFFAAPIGLHYTQETHALKVSDRKTYNHYLEAVQEALDVTNDIAEVVILAKRGKEALENLELHPGHPIKVMLFQKAKDLKEAFEKVGKPAAFEYKYDGFRLQIHKHEGGLTLFTRRLENVTEQFPDIVRPLASIKGNSFILDGEVVGYNAKTGQYKPFQEISQRIKRKYEIERLASEFPVEVNLFDILHLDGKSLLKTPFQERRKILEHIVTEQPGQLKLSTQIITEEQTIAQNFYDASLRAGQEGVMAKNLESIYKPGSRVGFGMKLKPTMETLEVIIIAAEWGEGKRGQWLSSFTIAVRDEETDAPVAIGKVGTGIKEKREMGVSFEELTQRLLPSIIEEHGRQVRLHPQLVLEVDYEEIQKSPTYASGFALRFPRLLRLREDRTQREINSLEDVKELYRSQRGRDSN